MIGLVGRSRRRYGGYIVHLGIVLMFLGFAGEGFKKHEQAVLTPGQQVEVGHFLVRHDALRVTQDAQKQMITGHITVFDDGKEIGQMRPAKWFFNKRENEPTTEVAIRRGLGEDIYVVLGGYEAGPQRGVYTVTINPLVNWVWFGFAVLAMGTGLTLMPERAFSFATAKVPSGAATTGLLVVLLLMPLPIHAHAEEAQNVTPVQRSELWKKLEGEIMCTCGCMRPMNDCPMEPNCHGLDEQRAKMEKFLAAGMSHDDVIAAFVKDYGSQQVLASPIDKGFNRLAWLFPYLIGTTAAGLVGFAARRWSRRAGEEAEAEAPVLTAEENELRTRLDDELRDLD
jgi:cytochrome c-type biogenesis protein CcmF